MTVATKAAAAKTASKEATRKPAAAPEASAGMSLVQRLSMASKLIKPVAKDGENGYQEYRFQSEAAIKAAVKPALEAAGVVIVPKYEVTNQYDRPGRKGTNHYVDVLGTFAITDGKTTLTGSMPGSGQDTGEKATMKAATASQKYFLKQLFNISDQETDPDTDASPQNGVTGDAQPTPPQMATQNDIEALKQLAQEHATQKQIEVGQVLQQVFAMAKVPNKPWTEITAEEMVALSAALAQVMRG